ncbi:MAG: hypothetical protein JXB05_11970 [Myxococcaceae bacterium]|nr:hypothetical protein [Myxococcaceae bacterium]
MSDGRKLPEQNAPPEEAEASSSPQRRLSNPGMPRTSNPNMRLSNPGMRAMSAARAAPAGKTTPQGPVGKRLASEASNQFLNGLSILKEMLQDFRTSDRFFKYKAGIVGGWVFISVLSIVIACPGQGLKTAELGARVTVLPNPDRPQAAPSLTVTNTDEDPWENVVFTVNGKYKAIVDKIDAGGIFTLTPKSLLSPTGPMPSDERFTNAEMRTDDGKAELVKNGVPLSE